MTTLVTAAVEVLRAGGLLIFPTETTYGAGVDATNPAAVQKLLAYKARREGKPLSIAVTDMAMAEQFVELTEEARRLYDRFLPGPVTVVSRSLSTVAPGVESEFGTLGVRIPDYQLVLDIVKALGKPMTATSANMSDGKRPYSLDDLLPELPAKQLGLIDAVIDAGRLPPNPPSTVIDTTHSSPVIFRQGEVTLSSGDTLLSTSEAETKALAGKFLLKHWNQLKANGLVVGLDGSLGAGKTVFAKGVAEFLGITEVITSPTYTYYQDYAFERHGVTGSLYHCDLWNIHSAAELDRLELKPLLKPHTVILIEWYSQVKPWLPAELSAQTLEVSLEPIEGDTQRRITFREPQS